MSNERELDFPSGGGPRNGGAATGNELLGGSLVDDSLRYRPLGDRLSQLGTNFLGSAGEALVIHDLLSRGYDVFCSYRHSSPVDLVAVCLHSGAVWRVQVKCRQRVYDRSPEGRRKLTGKMDALAFCDVLAVLWLPESELVYYRVNKESLSGVPEPFVWPELDSDVPKE